MISHYFKVGVERVPVLCCFVGSSTCLPVGLRGRKSRTPSLRYPSIPQSFQSNPQTLLLLLLLLLSRQAGHGERVLLPSSGLDTRLHFVPAARGRYRSEIPAAILILRSSASRRWFSVWRNFAPAYSSSPAPHWIISQCLYLSVCSIDLHRILMFTTCDVYLNALIICYCVHSEASLSLMNRSFIHMDSLALFILQSSLSLCQMEEEKWVYEDLSLYFCSNFFFFFTPEWL